MFINRYGPKEGGVKVSFKSGIFEHLVSRVTPESIIGHNTLFFEHNPTDVTLRRSLLTGLRL